MRRGDQYSVGEGDDILSRENAIHSDIDMRLDSVEGRLEAAEDGNRIDLDLLIERYNDTVAEMALRVEGLLDLAKSSISASIITETSTRQFLTPARREAILDELRGDAIESANTLGELHNLIQGYATPTDLAEAIAAITDGASSGRDTFGKLSTALDALAAKIAAVTAGSAAGRDTLKEVSDAIDDVAASVAAVTAGSASTRDTLKEVSDAVDAAASTASGAASAAAAITAGSVAARNTLKKLSDILDGRLAFDGVQALSGAQRDQASTNLGLPDRYVRADGSNRGQFGNRNRFVNGNFEVWQRGVSLPGASYNNRYICDMVAVSINGTNPAASYDRWYSPDTQKPCLRIQTGGAVADQTTHALKFFIESARTFAGKRVAVSFCARKFGSGASVTIAGVGIRQYFGTGGSPTPLAGASLVSAPADPTANANDQRFTYVFDMPSVIASTFGTNGDDHLYVLVSLPINLVFKVELSEFQVEEIGPSGPNVATPFERRSPAEYLAACQRYYEKSYDPDAAPGALNYNGAAYHRAQVAGTYTGFGTARFAVTKRAVPVVTLYNPATGATASPIRNSTAGADLAATVTFGGQGAFVAFSNATVAAGDSLGFHWIADASF